MGYYFVGGWTCLWGPVAVIDMFLAVLVALRYIEDRMDNIV